MMWVDGGGGCRCTLVCCSLLQRDAVCCSVLQCIECVAVCPRDALQMCAGVLL